MPSLRAFFALSSVILLSLVLAGTAAGAERNRVLAVEFASDINPVTQDYLNGAIDQANDQHYNAVVLLVDTPGGLDSAMRNIIKHILESKVPVIVYVYPPGSRDASAGVFITMASDVAAMAPETNIGSSTPISTNGGNIPSDLKRKVINDAVAYIRSLASEHGRNADWAEKAVRVAANLPARQALSMNVVDYIAPSLPALLDKIDGTRVEPKGIVLHTANAEVDTVRMSFWKRILNTIIDPNIIVLLLSIGTLGITVELFNPGLIFPGTVGAISLIVAFFGLQVLPVSAAGVLLILLAAAFFAAEPFVMSHGALALAGASCFVIGSLMLFDPAGPGYQVSLWVAIAIAGTFALLVMFAVTKIVQARRRRPVTGQEELVGQIGVVRKALDPAGFVFIHGELWQARTDGEPLEVGAPVQVDRIHDGLVLEVSRAETAEPVTA
ncbi:MAG TPA: nodulation protein NfeD [Gaiellaceae bacterium]|jgi:membrane-bound serine protease (ClpP class)|nr:nodulation protein NfeD [Gaiellaceae bacterium]